MCSNSPMFWVTRSSTSITITLGTVIVIDVLDLVTQNIGEFVFAHHQVEHAFADVDRTAGKRESVDHVVIGENGESVGQAAMRVDRHGVSDARDVLFESLLFGRELARLCGVASGEFPADGNFLFIGETREVHRNAGEIALRVGGHIQDGVGRHGSGLWAALAPIKSRERETQDEKENDEDHGALHRYWRIVSRYLV